jgi:hypothetical protein
MFNETRDRAANLVTCLTTSLGLQKWDPAPKLVLYFYSKEVVHFFPTFHGWQPPPPSVKNK